MGRNGVELGGVGQRDVFWRTVGGLLLGSRAQAARSKRRPVLRVPCYRLAIEEVRGMADVIGSARYKVRSDGVHERVVSPERQALPHLSLDLSFALGSCEWSRSLPLCLKFCTSLTWKVKMVWTVLGPQLLRSMGTQDCGFQGIDAERVGASL